MTFQARPSALQRPDHQRRGIELPAAQAVDGGAREGVVVVVPGLAERGEREPEDVGRLVVDLEAARAEEVADRVDAPGDVVDEEDPHQAAPEQAGGGAGQRAGDRKPASAGIARPSTTSATKRRLISRMPAVLVEVGRVALPVGAAVLGEQPAGVRVPEAAQHAADAVAVADVRAVRVALDVGVGVVLAVVGDPGDHRALDGHRAERGEERTRSACGCGRSGG